MSFLQTSKRHKLKGWGISDSSVMFRYRRFYGLCIHASWHIHSPPVHILFLASRCMARRLVSISNMIFLQDPQLCLFSSFLVFSYHSHTICDKVYWLPPCPPVNSLPGYCAPPLLCPSCHLSLGLLHLSLHCSLTHFHTRGTHSLVSNKQIW